MTLPGYLRALGSLSAVKSRLIRELWQTEGAPFPRPWVRSSVLLTITGQKYFDRRVRELRDELGCDIETASYRGEHSYRFRSEVIGNGTPRAYLTEVEKLKLFRRHSYRCQVCGLVFQPGVRGLQSDHKVPLIRKGSHQPSNWQPICNACNVSKRRACAGCNDDCQKCPWAYPERVGQVTLLRIPRDVLLALESLAGESESKLEAIVAQILRDYFSKAKL